MRPVQRIGKLAASLLVAAVLSSGGASVSRAAGSADIPGIPLPAPVVTGLLGGPVYDVVYQVQVPPAHVVVAGLTGSPGTDFDLYLFDSSATTVLTNVGVVARSTGPTSTESLSFPSRSGGTFYIDLNGATAVEGTYVLSVQVVADTTPPVVSSLLLDGGAVATNNPSVTVLIGAADPLSGVTDFALSGDGLSFGPWQAYGGAATWTFAPGDGTKRLWAKVRNGVGLESAPVSALIVLDTVPPSVVGVSPPGGSVVAALRPTIRVTFSEGINPVSWTSVGLALQGPTGVTVPGTASYDAVSQTGSFTPLVDLVPGTRYYVTVGAVVDVAGNAIIPTGSWTIEPLMASSVAMAAVPATLTFGTVVVVSGAAVVPAGSAVVLESRAAGSAAFQPAAQLLPGPTFSTSVTPTGTTSYRVSFAGSLTTAPSTSASVTVTVRWAVALAGGRPSLVRVARAGIAVPVVASVRPAVAGITVSFRLYRYDTSLRRFVYAGSRGTRTTAAGVASISWKPAAGRWQWRAVAYANVNHAANTSVACTWAVSR
jgi:hypothetical protein